MDKYIVGVDYRHPLLTAYLKVVGRSHAEAQGRAKRVGTVLKQKLPQSAEIRVSRYRLYDKAKEEYLFEIPIIIADCAGAAKAELAKLVLVGSV